MVTLYGISNCDTIKKAKCWLDNAGIEYRFHDYRKDGLEADTLNQWANELSWESLLNKRGITWRKLPEEEKSAINHDLAIQLMLTQPAMIKRPLLEYKNQKILGFSEQTYTELFSL
ncbi:arsenate reductase [Endozoicomonas sp. (ex Bugula neritina AB1)]|nr:arsenate reductase [Endozoicomonas sp. (ex Bugula neritina AB1)]